MDPPAKIEVVGRTVVRLTWEGRSPREIDAANLRRRCACADCRSREAPEPGRIRLSVTGGATVEDAQLVGDYGISFTFGPDGHRTGIYTWEMLSEV